MELLHILVVDDSPYNCAIVVSLLAPLGFQVTVATDGQMGLEQAMRHWPDLIITDIVMPTLDGFELSRQLRQRSPAAPIPIIAASASLSQTERQASLAAGCDAFLPKPLNFADLLQTLARLLHLTWRYAPAPRLPDSPQREATRPQAVPQPAELATLYRAAQGGFMDDICQEAEQLMSLNAAYESFAQQLISLAQQFEDEAIIQLIESHL